MPTTRIQSPIDIGFYESPSAPIANQQCVGLFPYTPMTKGASTPGGLLATHGLEEWAQVSAASNVTDAVMYKGELYVAAGRIYKIAINGTATEIGGAATTLATNGEVLCGLAPATVGGKAYFYDPTNGLRRITDSVYQEYEAQDGGVLDVTSGDGYFIFCTRKNLFHTDSVVNATLGTDFPALAFAEGESRPDNNVGVRFMRGELYLFGERSYERWRNVATEPFAFQRLDGATQEKGLAQRAAVVEADNTFFFAGAGPAETLGIWRHTGGTPQKVSTSAIDKVLESKSGAVGTSYASTVTSSSTWTLDGHIFVSFTIGVFNTRQMVYDVTESALQGRPVWHERDVSIAGGIWCAFTGYGKLMAGTYQRASLFKDDVFSVNGQRVPRTFTGAYLQNQGESLDVCEVELRAQSGTGLTGYKKDAEDREPQVLMEYSLDSGNTWKSKGYRSLGVNGEYKKRLVWRRVGRIPNTALFRFTVETKAKVAFTDLHFEVEGESR